MLDVDKVNLLKYPKFKEVKWEYANMTPGDCLYLPCGKFVYLWKSVISNKSLFR